MVKEVIDILPLEHIFESSLELSAPLLDMKCTLIEVRPPTALTLPTCHGILVKLTERHLQPKRQQQIAV